MIVHKNIRVKGKVQGVYFRASTVDMAKSLGLRGYVINERDGSVYMEVEGEINAVDQMVEWARTGPPHAHVDSLDITDGPVMPFKTFEIRR